MAETIRIRARQGAEGGLSRVELDTPSGIVVWYTRLAHGEIPAAVRKMSKRYDERQGPLSVTLKGEADD